MSMLCNERKRNNTEVSFLKTIYSGGSIFNEEIFHKAKDIFCGVEIVVDENGNRLQAGEGGAVRVDRSGRYTLLSVRCFIRY